MLYDEAKANLDRDLDDYRTGGLQTVLTESIEGEPFSEGEVFENTKAEDEIKTFHIVDILQIVNASDAMAKPFPLYAICEIVKNVLNGLIADGFADLIANVAPK